MRNYFKAYRKLEPHIHERVFFEDSDKKQSQEALAILMARVREILPNITLSVRYSVFRPYQWQPESVHTVGVAPEDPKKAEEVSA